MTPIHFYHLITKGITWLYTRLLCCHLSRDKGRQVVYMFNIPEHGNMGDQAIVLAERRFFEYFFPDFEYHDISDVQWEMCGDKIIKTIKSDDIICIHGGGYIGDLWPGAERQARMIIDSFPGRYIFMMPNTIYLHDHSKYRENLAFYDRENIFLFLRDKKSFDISRDSGLKNVELVPDTVAFMEDYSCYKSGKVAVLFCMRNDPEKVSDSVMIESMKNVITGLGLQYEITDTVNKHGVKMWNRKYHVEKKLKEFQSAALVITDRLHGMYFAAITGTPCIALDNISGKVKGGATWVDSSYIKTMDTYEDDEFKELVLNLLRIGPQKYDRGLIMNYFLNESSIIKGTITNSNEKRPHVL